MNRCGCRECSGDRAYVHGIVVICFSGAALLTLLLLGLVS